MRGELSPQTELFGCVDFQSRVPANHSIEKIYRIVDINLDRDQPKALIVLTKNRTKLLLLRSDHRRATIHNTNLQLHGQFSTGC